MPLLTVISGGPDAGKSLIQDALMALKPMDYALVARDRVRPTLCGPVDEGVLTHVLLAMAETLLNSGLNVLAVAQNQEPKDRERWLDVAQRAGTPLRWVSVELLA